MSLPAGPIVLDACRDFRRVWPQLVLTDLLARALATTVLAPLVALLLGLFLATTATGVVTDAAIAGFLLHPIGLTALVVVGSVSLAVLFADVGQLMVIAFGAVEDRRVTWLEALRYAVAHAGAFVQLGALALVRLLLVVLPFLGALGLLYWLAAPQYDINYYLAERPPGFVAAVLAAGVLLVLMAVAVTARIAGWLLALPMVLFEGRGGRDALRASSDATRHLRWRLTLWLVAWLVLTALASVAAAGVVGVLGNLLVPYGSPNLPLLFSALVVLILVSVLANLTVSIVTTTLFPLLVVRLYRTLAGPGGLDPAIAARGSLGARPVLALPGKGVLAAGAAALLLVTGLSVGAVQALDSDERVEIVAHRGGAAVAPENTMAAFRRGIADGADWLELDVQENADGVVVVEHDRDFMRPAGSSLQVWQATDADLADLDIGSSFDPAFAGERVPRLREVLELARDRAGVLIELKYYGFDEDLERKVVDIVEAAGMADDVAVMSLEYEGVRKTAALRPDWTYGLLNTVSLGDLTTLDLDFLALSAPAATRSMIRRAQSRGIRVYVWTINDPVQTMVMMSRGVDGIITDRVAMVRQVQDLRDQLGPLGRLVIWMAGEAGLLRGPEQASLRDDA